MWIPQTEREIRTAIKTGYLVETATFDAKAALPAKGKSKELPKDIAAMANDGGTLLYGVREDEYGRPTVPKPFGLIGAKERVDQIVRTSISEPPAIGYTRSKRMRIPASGISWSPSRRRRARHTWSRWGRRIATTGGALSATCV